MIETLTFVKFLVILYVISFICRFCTGPLKGNPLGLTGRPCKTCYNRTEQKALPKLRVALQGQDLFSTTLVCVYNKHSIFKKINWWKCFCGQDFLAHYRSACQKKENSWTRTIKNHTPVLASTQNQFGTCIGSILLCISSSKFTLPRDSSLSA